MLGRRTIEVDGVQYVLEPYDFETDLAITKQCVKTDIDQKAEKVIVETDTEKLQMLSIMSSLKTWTFRGFDAEGQLIVDPAVAPLEINEENIKHVPARHSSALRRIASEMNQMSADEVKNL